MATSAPDIIGRTVGGTTQSILAEYSHVRLRHDVQAGGTTYAAGTRGVVVHRHNDGIGYEVEFESPAFRVITLTAQDVWADHE
jgi:hypothetical protein